MSTHTIKLVTSVYVNGKLQTISETHRSTDLTLEDLDDVVITSPVIGDYLIWDGTDWINSSSAPTPIIPLISITEGIVAHAGGGQGSATACTAEENFIDTVATTNDSIKCVTALKGIRQIFHNDGVNALQIYPQVGEAFSGLAANAPLTIDVGGILTIACATNGTFRYY